MSAAEHTPAQLALLRIMERWRWVGEGARGVLLCAEERAVLRWLSEQAGGWWTWPTGEPEPIFVGMEEWKRRYARAREREEESRA